MTIAIEKDAQFTQKLFDQMIDHVRNNGGNSADLMSLVGALGSQFVMQYTHDKERGCNDLVEMIRTNVGLHGVIFPANEGLPQ